MQQGTRAGRLERNRGLHPLQRVRSRIGHRVRAHHTGCHHRDDQQHDECDALTHTQTLAKPGIVLQYSVQKESVCPRSAFGVRSAYAYSTTCRSVFGSVLAAGWCLSLAGDSNQSSCRSEGPLCRLQKRHVQSGCDVALSTWACRERLRTRSVRYRSSSQWESQRGDPPAGSLSQG